MPTANPFSKRGAHDANRRRARKGASSSSKRSRGGALLMVLWVSAALSAIAFSMASTVRGETERTATAVDSLRAYYLATSGIDMGDSGSPGEVDGSCGDHDGSSDRVVCGASWGVAVSVGPGVMRCCCSGSRPSVR